MIDVATAKQALVLIDIQTDFCPGGALAVPKGDEVVKVANAWMTKFRNENIIATQDWHPADHGSFAKNHKKADSGEPMDTYSLIMLNGLAQILWPTHCVQNTEGADFHKDLDMVPVVFCKGEDPTVDSYSGFFDNGKRNKTQLDAYLKENGIDELFIMGLATDYCVKFTVIDALELGYKVNVIADGCRAVNLNPGDDVKAFNEMKAKGANIIY